VPHKRSISLVAALLALAACTGGGRTTAQTGQPGGSAPAATVERFLQLVGQKNYVQMGYVFGNSEGPIIERDERRQVERRMFAIAGILQNDRFVIRDQSQIPGRPEAVQFNVQLTQRGQAYDVPFVVVRSGERWFVEQVDLERLTRRP